MDSAARDAISLSDTQQLTRTTGNLITKKIWLPKFLYDLLPYFYIGSGVAAFFATVYISAWFWVLPQYLLFSVVCLHLGIIVYRRRTRRDIAPEDLDNS